MLSPLPVWRVGWAPLAAPSPWYFFKAVLGTGMGGRTGVLVGLGPSPPHTLIIIVLVLTMACKDIISLPLPSSKHL